MGGKIGLAGIFLILVLASRAIATPPFPGVNPDFPAPGADTPAGVNAASPTLLENAKAWDGRVITFTGEAIGEAMTRGTMAWIHVNDDAYMWQNIEEGARLDGYNSGQAVWLPVDFARRIVYFGDYKHEGDVVRVRGEFHAACRQHGGDMDIHAADIEIMRQGHPVSHKADLRRLAVAVCLLLFAAAFYLARRHAEKRRI